MKNLGVTTTHQTKKIIQALDTTKDKIFVNFAREDRESICLYPFYKAGEVQNNGMKGLIIFESKKTLKHFKKDVSGYRRKMPDWPDMLFIGLQDDVKKELALLGQNPSILVSTPNRIIDMMRQGLWDEPNLDTVLFVLKDNKSGFAKDAEFIMDKIVQVGQRLSVIPRERFGIVGEDFFDSPEIVTPSLSLNKGCKVKTITFLNEDNRRRLLPDLIYQSKEKVLLLCTDWKLIDSLAPMESLDNVRLAHMSDHESFKGVKNVYIYAQPKTPMELVKALQHLSSVDFQGRINILLNETDSSEFHNLKEIINVGISKDEMQEKLLLFKESVEKIIDQIKDNEDLDEMQLYKKLFKKSVPFHMRSYVGAYLLKNTMGKSLKRSNNKVTLFISIGRNRRVYPRDLVGLFSAAAGIQKSEIGDIKILDSYSFMEINPKAADKAIEVLDGTEYRGRKITVNHAKKKS
ncbi:DbpA RNA binding domain-containing protein [Spirochaeta cellobiosiphila]|uniref:DbpA RNA binding domain-containing protein n=1 Tax=Spirochaeta cellobiosiphila TaxID=504483 RepID=UPI001B7FC312|nr:DbpA RNA binding domain-containing protein [Spirochaeta cellobiosiphila]